jgi:hypothetical protein
VVIELIPDHGGRYLWDRSPEGGHGSGSALDPEDLGLSNGLIERLEAWYETWEKGWGRMSRRYSPTGGSGQAAWRREGLRLAVRLQKELGPDVRVVHGGSPTSR